MIESASGQGTSLLRGCHPDMSRKPTAIFFFSHTPQASVRYYIPLLLLKFLRIHYSKKILRDPVVIPGIQKPRADDTRQTNDKENSPDLRNKTPPLRKTLSYWSNTIMVGLKYKGAKGKRNYKQKQINPNQLLTFKKTPNSWRRGKKQMSTAQNKSHPCIYWNKTKWTKRKGRKLTIQRNLLWITLLAER